MVDSSSLYIKALVYMNSSASASVGELLFHYLP